MSNYPTKWRVAYPTHAKGINGYQVVSEDTTICIASRLLQSDAEKICTALNSHIALVEALGALLAGVAQYLDGDGDESKLKQACRVASEARKLAKES